MQDEEIASGGFEHSLLERLLEEFLWWGQVREEGAPGADFCFAGALDEDVKVSWERGEEGEDGGKECVA